MLVQRLWQKHEWQKIPVPAAKQKLPELCKLLHL